MLRLFSLDNFKNYVVFIVNLRRDCCSVHLFELNTRQSRFLLLFFHKLCVANKKNAAIHIYVCHGCRQHIFDSPAAIIRNLLARIPDDDVLAAIRSITYINPVSKTYGGFMDLLIFIRAGDDPFFSSLSSVPMILFRSWLLLCNATGKYDRLRNGTRLFSDLQKRENKVTRICIKYISV